ncbi:MAG: hypothetical protein D6798_04945 [Deltaproteobacteria bacterium]|nr:MAG: hypothetical protein D6798_04945 [Deltaproteobacteria bacterium]
MLPVLGAPLDRFAGDPRHPDGAGTVWTHWLVHEHGLGAMRSLRLVGWPQAFDILVVQGFPLDGLASWPFDALLGWPAGFGLFQLATLWAAGLSASWLAARWWRSAPAGLVAGVATQVAAPVLFELAQGRSTQVFALVFLPLALGLFADALVSNRQRSAVLAGIAVAASALSWWYMGFFCAIGLAVLAILARVEGAPPSRPAVTAALTAACIAGPPAGLTFAHLGQQGGTAITLSDPIAWAGTATSLQVLLEERDAIALLPEGAVAFTPVLWALAVAGAAGRPARRWLAPLSWILVAVLLSLGPVLGWVGSHPLPGPFAALSMVPVLRRLWWPARALLLATVAVAVLAGGGAARLVEAARRRSRRLPGPALGPVLVAMVVAVGLLVEAHLALPTLPLPVTSARPSAQAEALRAGHGPVLVLPQERATHTDGRGFLLDQVFHGRPVVNTMMPPDLATAPAAVRTFFAAQPALQALYACAEDDHPRPLSPSTVQAALARLAVAEVVADHARIDAPGHVEPGYFDCLVSLLGPPDARRGPYSVWAVSSIAERNRL